MRKTCQYFEDETVQLDDGADYTAAIFRRCQLIYSGGPLKIDDALFYECEIGYTGKGNHVLALHAAIFRSLYAEGFRTIQLNPDGGYSAR